MTMEGMSNQIERLNIELNCLQKFNGHAKFKANVNDTRIIARQVERRLNLIREIDANMEANKEK